MIIYSITKKVIRGFFGNLIFIPILIGMPILQIFVMSAIFKEMLPTEVISSNNQLVEIVLLREIADVNMIQQFTVALVVMFIMLTGIILATTEIGEKEDNTRERILSTPIKASQYMIGTLLGQFIIILLAAATLIFGTEILFNVSWGKSIIGLTTMTLSLIFVSISMGMFFSSIFTNSKIASGVMSFIIVVMTFLSGGLTMGGFERIKKLTVNWWASEGYIKLMEGYSIEAISSSVIILSFVGCIFTIATIISHRREKIYG